MKKVFVVSLLLASIFLIGNAGMALALAQCSNYQEYECTYTVTQYGELVENGTDCLSLCYDDGFEVYINSPFFNGYLYPATGSKYLLGTAYDYTFGWTGCSVERKGNSIITKLSYVEEGEGFVVIFKCKPCDDCCGS